MSITAELKLKHTEADFADLSWHDCRIRGFKFDAGNPERNDWTSDLALDIDFITEWICRKDRAPISRVAPASLVFHGVTDLKIDLNFGDSQHRVSLSGVSIDRIERKRVKNQKVFLDRPYFRWTILLNTPPEGQVSFGAVGFTQLIKQKITKRVST